MLLRYIAVKIAFVLCFFKLCFSIDTTENYLHGVELRPGEFSLYWKIENESIVIEVHGKTQGWVGFGFSPDGGMTDSDIYVGWVKDGIVHITDRHGVKNGFPPMDEYQSIELISGRECGNWTMLKFRRNIASCEPQDWTITSDTQRLIWAYGQKDPIGDDLSADDYHGAILRGTKNIFLIDTVDSIRQTHQTEKSTLKMQFTTNNIKLPPVETYYHCKLIELPDIPEKHHIIKISPLITKGNELVVHHAILYECEDDLNNEPGLTTEGHCYAPNMPSHYQRCRTMIGGFAIGGGDFYFPPKTGYPFGGIGSSRYVQIELHYDNQQLRDDIIDSSGFEITYTKDLRPYATGMLMLGNSVNGFSHYLPPKAPTFMTTGQCTSDCLNEAMVNSRRSKITVFASLLHTHTKGKSVYVRHFRNGTELPYIAKDSTYDFNYQAVRFTSEHEILPTDSIHIQCTYNTSDADEAIIGGLGIKQEMCVTFVFYYPRIDLVQCTSVPVIKESYALLNISEFNITGVNGMYDVSVTKPQKLSGMSGMDVINKIPWNDDSIQKFSKDLMKITQIQRCEGHQFTLKSDGYFHSPEILHPYTEPKQTCKDQTKMQSRITVVAEMKCHAQNITPQFVLVVLLCVTQLFISVG